MCLDSNSTERKKLNCTPPSGQLRKDMKILTKRCQGSTEEMHDKSDKSVHIYQNIKYESPIKITRSDDLI